jgi:hypothetical protein
MSKSAYVHLVEQIPAIRKMQFTDSKGKPRHIGETGAWLLMYLCSELNKDGTFFMTAESMRELTGTSTVSEIRRLLAGFEQLGLITRTGEEISYLSRGRPTPVYAMTFVPGLWKKNPISSPLGSPLSSPGATNKNSAEPYAEKETALFSQIEPEPKPDPDPKPDPQPVSAGAGKEGGGSFLEVLAGCMAWERTNFTGIDKGGLAKTWEKDYRQIIPRVLADQNPQSTDEAVTMCVTQRNASRGLLMPTTSTSTTAKRNDPGNTYGADPDCTLCDGWGYHQVRADDDMGWTNRKCVCAGGTHTGTQEPTTKRVSTDESANTYIPTPGDTADPQSAIRDLTKSLRMPG